MVSIIESNGGGQGGVISERSKHLVRFYAAMDELERRLGGARILGQCAGRMTWPPRGVYFVREPGELRFDGRSPRIVRVGTHAIKNPNEKSQLRGRIRTHRGNRDGGGNHRGSSFRLCVGQAILERDHHSCRSWAVGRMAATAARRFGVTSAEILRDERPIEEKVSAVICAMSILWLPIDDARVPIASVRTSSATALRCSAITTTKGSRSTHSRRVGSASTPLMRGSVDQGYGVSDYVDDERYDPAFLDRLEDLIGVIKPLPRAL